MVSKIVIFAYLATLLFVMPSLSEEKKAITSAPYVDKDIAASIDKVKRIFSSKLDEDENLGKSKEDTGDLALIKMKIEQLRKTDSELSDKYNKLYQSSRDLDNTVDDVITYISNIKRNDEVFVRAKKLLYPMEDILLESVQSARTINI